MFIVEAQLKKRRAKIDEWEEDCRNWINAGNGNYNYRTRQDYERQHPYPVIRWNKVAQVGVPILAGVFLTTGIIIGIVRWNPPQEKVSKANPNDCTTIVHKGEKVGISYGNFSGSKGTVIRQSNDCSVDITLTSSTNTFDQCKQSDSSNDCGGTQSNGSVLHIDKSDNVIPL